MKRLFLVLLLTMGGLCFTALSYSQPLPNADAQARADAKSNRKQAKAQKKYAKAQKKAEKKMLKTERQNSYKYPSKPN